MPARQREAWNDEDIAILQEMARDGAPLLEIARRLERTREAVAARGRMIGLKLRS